jgi:hypothetical protein
MRHSDIRTTMNVYGDSLLEDERAAHEKVVKLALTDRKLIAKPAN